MKKILIVEDEKPIARALELKLTGAGYKIGYAGNGEEALAYLEHGKPDLILLDLIMPKMDGFSTLETLKKNGSTIPVVVLTNLGQGEDITRAKDLGAKDFFIKSNTPIADIVEKVKTFLK